MNTFLARVIISTTLIATVLLVVIYCDDDQEILFESQESKTETMAPVYNKIRSFSFKDKDVWMMNQSHNGPHINNNQWDRLAIVVDKTKKPYQASFYQLESGPLTWQENLKKIPYKVSCFMCHSNGPRVIRANLDSPLFSSSAKDRLTTFWWNLKIKSYGRVVLAQTADSDNPSEKIPLRWSGSFDNQNLQIATCLKCHKETGFFARGTLLRQQIPTIKFMLERGYMPPMGFSLPPQEKQALDRFIRGF